MHWADFLIYGAAAAAGLLAARCMLRGSEVAGAARVALALLAGIGYALGLVAFAALWLRQPGDPWNAARLAPAIGLHHGHALYQPLGSGPVLSTVVGPVAFLAYWPVGFVRGTPTSLILAGSALNLSVFCFLIRAILRRAADDAPARLLAGLAVLALALSIPALRYSLFCIHADAPALALASAGLCVLLSPGEITWRRALAAGGCFSLGIWAKQSLAPIVFAGCLAAASHDGWRGARRVFAGTAAIGAATSALLIAWIGFDALWLNMIQVPSAHPWMQMSLTTGETFPHVAAAGAAARVKVLAAAVLQIVRTNWPLFALLAAVVLERLFRRERGEPVWPREPWTVFGLTAIVMLPTAALGRVKLGGEVNHESFSVFFLVLAFGAWLASVGKPTLAQLRVAGVAGVLVVTIAPRALDYTGWRDAWSNQNEQAYLYNRAHPDRVYFPWNPLTPVLTNGTLQHFDYGVFDRNLGGAHVTAAHLASAIPTPRPLIASGGAHHDYILRTYFADYVARPPDHALPGWRLYGPPLHNNSVTPPAK